LTTLLAYRLPTRAFTYLLLIVTALSPTLLTPPMMALTAFFKERSNTPSITRSGRMSDG
jgi:hypothetical protein